MRRLRYKNHNNLVLLKTLNTRLEVKTSQLRFYSIVPGSEIKQGVDFPQISYIDVLNNWELGDLDTGEILSKYLSVFIINKLLKHGSNRKGRQRLKEKLRENKQNEPERHN